MFFCNMWKEKKTLNWPDRLRFRFNGAYSHTNAHVYVNTKCVHNAICFYAGTQQQGWADIDSVADKWCFSPDLWLMAASVSCLSAGRRELQAPLLFLSFCCFYIISLLLYWPLRAAIESVLLSLDIHVLIGLCNFVFVVTCSRFYSSLPIWVRITWVVGVWLP